METLLFGTKKGESSKTSFTYGSKPDIALRWHLYSRNNVTYLVKFMTHVFLSNIDYKRRKEINHLVVTTRKFKPTAFFHLESTGSALNQSWANLSETKQAGNHKCGRCGGVEYDNSKAICFPEAPDSLRTAAFALYWFVFSLASCLSFSPSCTQCGLFRFEMVGLSTKLSEKESKEVRKEESLPHPTGLWLFLEATCASRRWLLEPQVSVSITL